MNSEPPDILNIPQLSYSVNYNFMLFLHTGAAPYTQTLLGAQKNRLYSEDSDFPVSEKNTGRIPDIMRKYTQMRQGRAESPGVAD